MNVLAVYGSAKPIDESATIKMTDSFLNGFKKNCSNPEIKEIKLYEEIPPFYDYNTYRCQWYPVFFPHYNASEEELSSVKYINEHTRFFNNADILLLAAPIWNFSVPAIVKAWIDQIIIPGKTFEFDTTGDIIPLHKVKKCVIFSSSSDIYFEKDPREHGVSLLKTIFNFIKITDIHVIKADGQNPIMHQGQEERLESAIIEAFELGEKIGKNL